MWPEHSEWGKGKERQVKSEREVRPSGIGSRWGLKDMSPYLNHEGKEKH